MNAQVNFFAAIGVSALMAVGSATVAGADLVAGGGSKTFDCMAVFDAVGPNHPPPPKAPRNIDCTDGDAACDTDGLRNGRCIFEMEICVNSTMVAECTPQTVDDVTVEHAIDDGDAKFDPDFQALQQRVDLLGFPGNTDADACTATSAVTVLLKAPKAGNVYKRNKKQVRLESDGLATGKPGTDKDKMKLTCRPEGDGVYLPLDLYTGTFDRIRNQIFVQSCALSSCHDSESSTGGLILYPNVAYSQLVGVVPTNVTAAGDGLERIMPGDPDLSFLYRKITHDLEPGYGEGMPSGEPQLSPDLIEIVRLWILGDMTLGPAPLNGWVEGTDQ